MTASGRALRALGIVMAAAAVVIILIGAWWPQIVVRLTYQPQDLPLEYRDPGTFGYAGQQVEFSTADGETLHGWFLSRSAVEERGCVVLFTHGNAGNVSSHAGFMRPFLAAGFDAFLFDYRGYGASTGRPSERGLYADALAAFDQLVSMPEARDRPVLIASHSLGTAVATHLATRRDVIGVILAAPFPSFPDAFAFHASWAPVGLLPWQEERFDSRSRIGRIEAPLMVVAGSGDRLVPPALSRELYDSALVPKTWIRVPGGHNEVFRNEQFTEGLGSFANSIPECRVH